jgi:predicted nuclease of predicted toxin-antitoxin system
MRLKLDENLGRSALAAFERAGFDTSTVSLQGLQGATDDRLLGMCREERRVLVTCDLDFANPLVHDPRPTAGIAVLRLPRNPGPTDVLAAIAVLVDALSSHDVAGSLWIVREARVRVWTPTES